ncbi:hypothetical protein BC936DRAFT_137226 [Jimgerdemannia flammicorona]|uniref:P-loop containing nucleoside triphosphate hydrolase protein n=1 Tax=Jimgerdemannia flammicorona TaxID=994334 RepID=A0A433CXT9_9FUNG|nr:hypothetical protein BC936DRAFT_137226 [Jimgerdemannia flammicorona]
MANASSSIKSSGPRTTTFEREITANDYGTVYARNQIEMNDIYNSTLHLDGNNNCNGGLSVHSRICQTQLPRPSLARARCTRDDNRKDSSLQPVALIGLGGMSKTQTVLEYCFRNFPSKYWNVFWITANSEESLNLSFLKVAKLLELSIAENENPTVCISLVKE